jgi:hypothetical protein
MQWSGGGIPASFSGSPRYKSLTPKPIFCGFLQPSNQMSSLYLTFYHDHFLLQSFHIHYLLTIPPFTSGLPKMLLNYKSIQIKPFVIKHISHSFLLLPQTPFGLNNFSRNTFLKHPRSMLYLRKHSLLTVPVTCNVLGLCRKIKGISFNWAECGKP